MLIASPHTSIAPSRGLRKAILMTRLERHAGDDEDLIFVRPPFTLILHLLHCHAQSAGYRIVAVPPITCKERERERERERDRDL
jgi:hypothetical protein